VAWLKLVQQVDKVEGVEGASGLPELDIELRQLIRGLSGTLSAAVAA
jgi:hypothetical protein